MSSDNAKNVMERDQGFGEMVCVSKRLRPAEDQVARVDNGDLQAGCVIQGKYRLARLIGKGGMGEVWEAHHAALDRTVAIKFPLRELADDPLVLLRFQLESRLNGRTKHPGIVDVFDFGNLLDGRPYIVFEYLSGETLDSYLGRVGSVSAAEAVVIVDQVCAAMEHAHAQGVIHRDLKPSNVFLHRPTGAGTEVKLLDFGIGKAVGKRETLPSFTRLGQVVGTPSYMSYEQARGEQDIDERTDIWNVGLLFYELLTGVRAYERSDFCATVASVVSESPPPLHHWGAKVPEKLADVVFRCLRWERDERFQSMRELREALKDVTSESEGLARESTKRPGGMPEAAGREEVNSVTPYAQTIAAPSVEEALETLGLSSRRPGFSAAVVIAALMMVAATAAYQWGSGLPRGTVASMGGSSETTYQPISRTEMPRLTAPSLPLVATSSSAASASESSHSKAMQTRQPPTVPQFRGAADSADTVHDGRDVKN